MKWVGLIILLFFGGAFFYWISSDSTASWQGTPMGPAKDFVYAAADGDYELATLPCAPEIAEQARAVAKRLHEEGVDPRAVVFKPTADPKTLTALVNGRILTVEVVERAPDDFMITMIDFGS